MSKKEINKPLAKKIIGAVISLIIFSVCVYFGVPYFNQYVGIALWCSIGVIATIFLISILKSIQSLYKIGILIVYFASIVIIFAIIIFSTGFLDILLNAEDGEQLYHALEARFGNNLYLALIIIQFLQVTFIPIASSIVTAAGFYLCGQNIGLTILFCCVGLWLGSLFAFFLGRVFGVRLVKWVAGEKMLIKYNKFLKGKDKVMLGYMFMFPIYPDDVLCLIAGLTTMSYREFIFLQLLSRPINVASTVLLLAFGTNLTTLFPLDTWWGITIWVLAIAIFVVTFILVWKKADKLEVVMNKVVSNITGRPILNDINTIYKLSTAVTTEENNENKVEEEVVATELAVEDSLTTTTSTTEIEGVPTEPIETEEEREERLAIEALASVGELLQTTEESIRF